MPGADYLGLATHGIIARLRDGLLQSPVGEGERGGKVRNIIAVRDDMLYAWHADDQCVLALNIKTALGHEGRGIIHQTLLPLSPPLFAPDRLVVNGCNSLLAAFGSHGCLVFELPALTPPFGTFYNNKEVNYLRTHSLHEQALAFSTRVEIRQVRFHPAESEHVCVLTSDNHLRVFAVSGGVVEALGVYTVGASVTTTVPSLRMSLADALGETVKDFDFGAPEMRPAAGSVTKAAVGYWPVYVLNGDGSVYVMHLILGAKKLDVLGPFRFGVKDGDYCALNVMDCTPTLLAVANCKGYVHHVFVLDAAEEEHEEDEEKVKKKMKKKLVLLESLELELGYTLDEQTEDDRYMCPLYLHKDGGAGSGSYFVTHETGLHAVQVGCVQALKKFVKAEEAEEEVLLSVIGETSKLEYLICTKTSEEPEANPILGFAVYNHAHCYLALLADGQLVTMPIVQTTSQPEDIIDGELHGLTEPLKKMGNEWSIAQHLGRILRQGATQPLLKLSVGGGEAKSQQECYKLLQRAAVDLRAQIANHERVRVEIESRARALSKLKECQIQELDRMGDERVRLQENAEALAEKYEALNENQEKLRQRCQQVLIAIAKMQDVPSHAEDAFHEKLKNYDGKLQVFAGALEKLKQKIKYQEHQMRSHQASCTKNLQLSGEQTASFKATLCESTQKIGTMMKEVNSYKNQLNMN